MTDGEKLLAIEEIKQLKARYCRFVDTKDWRNFEDLLTEDAVFDRSADARGNNDVEDFVFKGPAAIVNMARTPLADATSVHHVHSPEIELTSDTTARGIWAMADIVRWPKGSPMPLRSLEAYGHYLETYERVDGCWRIKSIRLTRLIVDVEKATHKSDAAST